MFDAIRRPTVPAAPIAVASYTALPASANDGDWRVCSDTGLVVRYLNGALDDTLFVPSLWLPAWCWDLSDARPTVLKNASGEWMAWNQNVAYNDASTTDVLTHGWLESLVGSGVISIAGGGLRLAVPAGGSISFYWDVADPVTPATDRVLVVARVSLDALVAGYQRTTLSMRMNDLVCYSHFRSDQGIVLDNWATGLGQGKCPNPAADTWLWMMVDAVGAERTSHLYNPAVQAQGAATLVRASFDASVGGDRPVWWLSGAVGNVQVTISRFAVFNLPARAS